MGSARKGGAFPHIAAAQPLQDFWKLRSDFPFYKCYEYLYRGTQRCSALGLRGTAQEQMAKKFKIKLQ